MSKTFKPQFPTGLSAPETLGPLRFNGVSLRKAAALSALFPALFLSACAVNPYRPQTEAMTAVEQRAESQTMGDVQVRVAVPSPEETQAIFDLPLYDRGVQPVWIEVQNRSASNLRYAPVGTDPDYVPAFEVAYTHKSGFSGTAREEMQRYLHDNVMPRWIGAGETGSGFVFTQARPGTKGVNVDLYGRAADAEYNFVFFVPVPGFVADHAQVNFAALYSPEEMSDYDLVGLRDALGKLPCCSSDKAGVRDGDPLNLVLVGAGDDVLQALLRAGWFERIAAERGLYDSLAESVVMYGRTADAVFRKLRPGTNQRSSELRLWKAPMRLDEKPVWVGDVVHFLAGPEGPVGVDPDIDYARDFFLQDLWYSQGLAKFAWLRGSNEVPIDRPRKDAIGESYFTDGYRAVLWPSGEPFSLLETDYLAWDNPPRLDAGAGR